MKKVFLFEDHDEALDIWVNRRVKGLDLIHVDAHIDLRFYKVRSVKEILNNADSVAALKDELQRTVAYMKYENNLERQRNIGNYIYPAIRDGIVKDFFWVVPGDKASFDDNSKVFEDILLKVLAEARQEKLSVRRRKGSLSLRALNRCFFVGVLDALPVFEDDVLLDIDTDFLVTSDISCSDPHNSIGERNVWMQPSQLVDVLKSKIKKPRTVTIAYSVNGGYTPMQYRYLAYEIAFGFDPVEFAAEYKRNQLASDYFARFIDTGRTVYYRKAVALNACYRGSYNNYGFLYLESGKFSKAEKEFNRILKADPENAACLYGLGRINFRQGNYRKAGAYLRKARKYSRSKIFSSIRDKILLELAETQVHLNELSKARVLLNKCRQKEPLNPRTHYLLSKIFYLTGFYYRSFDFLKSAVSLGVEPSAALPDMVKIAVQAKKTDDIIHYIIMCYNRSIKEGKELTPRNTSVYEKIGYLEESEKDLKIIAEKVKRFNAVNNAKDKRR